MREREMMRRRDQRREKTKLNPTPTKTTTLSPFYSRGRELSRTVSIAVRESERFCE